MELQKIFLLAITAVKGLLLQQPFLLLSSDGHGSLWGPQMFLQVPARMIIHE